MRRTCAIASVLLALQATAAEEKGLPAGVEKIDYLGWKDCYKLTNAHAEVVVVPAVGRAVAFRGLPGQNVFLLYPEFAGKVKGLTDPYMKLGGLYTWLAPQAHWSKTKAQREAKMGMAPPLDCLPCEVAALGERSVTLVRRDEGQYRVVMEKTYALDEAAAKLTYTVKVTNHNAIPIRWAIWNLVAARPEGKVVFSCPDGWNDFHFLFEVQETSGQFKPHVTFVDSLAVVDFGTMRLPGRKAFIEPAAGYVAHFMTDAWLVRTFADPKEEALYTDNHSQIELWAEPAFFEIEVLSPDVKIDPRESYLWEERLTIVSPKDVPWPEDLTKLKETIGQLVEKASPAK